MFASRTLPGVSESKKKVERKHGEGNSLLCQERARERERRRKGDGEKYLFGWPVTPGYMDDDLHHIGIRSTCRAGGVDTVTM
jgi:hypothetical protein